MKNFFNHYWLIVVAGLLITVECIYLNTLPKTPNAPIKTELCFKEKQRSKIKEYTIKIAVFYTANHIDTITYKSQYELKCTPSQVTVGKRAYHTGGMTLSKKHKWRLGYWEVLGDFNAPVKVLENRVEVRDK